MSLLYTITVAEPADEFDIAKLHALAFDPDLITRVLFPKDPYHDGHAKWVLELFRRAEAEPDALCLKAVETATGKIIGAAMLQTKPPRAARGSGGPFRSVQNQEFFKAYFPQAGPIYKKFYGDEKHACMCTAQYSSTRDCTDDSRISSLGLSCGPSRVST